MKPSLHLLLLTMVLYCTHAMSLEPTKLLLWPQGAPLAKGLEATDQPWLDFYPAYKHQATGAAMVVCPGGGYGALTIDHEGEQVALHFHRLGIACFVLHYRLGSKGYHYPTQLLDVQRAIRTVRARAAEWALDPQRIGIMGFSAGGHLTSMAATMFDEKPAGMTNDVIDQVSARPDIAVPVYPVISLAESFSHGGSRKNLLGPQQQDESLAAALSTEKHVTAQTPPCFIFQTDADTAVPAENAVHFYLALRKAKIASELHVFQPGKHGVGLAQGDAVLSVWPDLLTTWLRGRGFLK